MNANLPDKLDMMIALGAKDCGNDDVDLLDNLDTSSVALGKSFHRKKVRIVEKHKHFSTVLLLKKGVLCMAMVLMIAMSFGFSTIMAIAPMRTAVFEVIIEWHKNYLAIHYTPTDAGSTPESEATQTTNDPTVNTPAVVPPTVIEEVRKPTRLSPKVVEDVIMQNKSFVCIDYYINDEFAYMFCQMPISEAEKYVDNSGVIINTVDINGNEGTVMQYADFSNISILWCDGEYIYQIITESVPLEDLLAVCKSVR